VGARAANLGGDVAARARILAIDDQLYFRNFLVGLLSEEGYDVVAASPGAGAGQALVERGPFDLVVMDVIGTSAPGDAVAAVRTRAPDPAVLVVTGLDDIRAAVSALQQGACDYLLKPIDRGALLAAIHRALHSAGSSSGPGQLLDENIEFMGRLSLLERVLPLLAELELQKLANGLLELACVEACGTQGDLWVATQDDASLRLRARFGSDAGRTTADCWQAPNVAVHRTLCTGMAVIAPDPSGVGRPQPALFVPFLCEGELIAIARVARRVDGEFNEPDAQASLEVGELGGLAIKKALHVERLRANQLREASTDLPGRGFFDCVAETEIQRAHRFGRRLCCLCVEVGLPKQRSALLRAVVDALGSTLRTTDVLCAEDAQHYWVLVTETDPLGGVVLKRRLADAVRNAAADLGDQVPLALGVASYPLDGETREALMECAQERVVQERDSVIHELGFELNEPLVSIGERLLRQAVSLPANTLSDVAEFLIGELTCRPHDSGLLFLAPGGDPAPIMAPLMAMGDAETATEVFLATDGDTVPACSALTAVALPADFSSETTWIVRFGEGPPYAMLAGPPDPDGTRKIYHSTDPVLVEHMTFRLCAEVGVGVRS